MGTTYFGLFVDDDEDREVFLFAPVSAERFAAIRSGQLALRRAFQQPHDGYVFVAEFGLREPTETVVPVRATEIDADWLPDEEAHLEYETPTAPALSLDEVGADAVSGFRTVAAFELDTPFRTTEFGLRGLGEIMTLVQENVDSLAQVVQDKKTSRGAVQRDILEATELNFRMVKAASFAFVISPTPDGRLIENPLAEQSLSLLLRVLGAGAQEDQLREALLPLHPRALTKYRDLLEALEDVDSGVTMVLADPSGEITSSSLDLEGVTRSLRLVRSTLNEDDSRSIDVEALLVGINTRTHSFELYADSIERKYSGKVAKEARRRVVGLTVGHRYEATLLEQSETVPLTGETRYKYRLQDIWEPGTRTPAGPPVRPTEPPSAPAQDPGPVRGGLFAPD